MKKVINKLLLSALFLTVTTTMDAGKGRKKGTKQRKVVQVKRPDVPIVYHPKYTPCKPLDFWPLSEIHSFDILKYKKVFKYLTKDLGIAPHRFYSPSKKVSDKQLLKVHTKKYLESLKDAKNVRKIVEDPYLPNFLQQFLILDSMKWATQGTVLAARLALEYGWAINIGGGYHHARRNDADEGGYCIFSDIMLAITEILKQNPKMKILYVDLDAHQGNGPEAYLAEKKFKNNFFALDVYCKDNGFPEDLSIAKKYIKYDCPIPGNITEEDYLKLVDEKLTQAIKECKPDFVFYNAGTDILKNDPEGKMTGISQKGIIKRDELVFRHALKNKCKIVKVTSGGYTKQSSIVIGKSIENIIKKFKLVKIK